jgi:hypothetical protein
MRLPCKGLLREMKMTARHTYILAGLLAISLFCRADSGEGNELSAAEYRGQLEQLLAATEKLDGSERSVPAILRVVPPGWRVHTDRQDFDISAEGLRRDVRKFEQEKTLVTAGAVRSRIKTLRDDLDGFQASPQDVSHSRERLAALLARPEFSDVRGPTFADRLKQKLLAIVVRMLEFLFRSSAIPTISKVFVYGLIGFAVLTLGFIAYRHIKAASQQESVVPAGLPVPAGGWTLYLAQARAAAARNDWREAIHCAYWTGIWFLEQKGTWRPDRARTPREYLGLLSKTSDHRETLALLTRVFELTWYAKREADANAFSRMIQALETLGCHPS